MEKPRRVLAVSLGWAYRRTNSASDPCTSTGTASYA
jgi:hypothetical protein